MFAGDRLSTSLEMAVHCAMVHHGEKMGLFTQYSLIEKASATNSIPNKRRKQDLPVAQEDID